MYTQSALSLEYVKVPVSARLSGVAVNPTSDTVVMAFPLEGVAPTTWLTSVWETDTTTNPDMYYAKCLVGPAGTVTLAVGTYDVWVRVTDSPEVPARRAGNIQIV